jgi:hypothetical protein
MLHEQHKMILTQSNVQEWTHILLMNTLCLYLHSFCANGMSCGLATTVILNWVSWRRLGVYYTGVDLLLNSFLYHSTCLLLGCILNGTPCTYFLKLISLIWLLISSCLHFQNNAWHPLHKTFTHYLVFITCVSTSVPKKNGTILTVCGKIYSEKIHHCMVLHTITEFI